MNARRIIFVTAVLMIIVTPAGVAAGVVEDSFVLETFSEIGSEAADGAQNIVIKITYPASRESVLEALAGNIVLACKLPELQHAASLTENQCRTQVMAAKDACKVKARERIPDRLIQSKGQFEGEIKIYLDCLIPPTSSAPLEFSGPDVLA